MRCEQCGRKFQSGLVNCPYCGASAHYGSNTTFFIKAATQKLTIADFFNGVFAKHPKGTGARMFMSGTSVSTPSPDRMLSEWTKPWLFMWVLLAGVVYHILMYIMVDKFGNPFAFAALLSLGSLIIPAAIIIFFWEINIPRDIPLYNVILMFFIGGALSLLISLFFYDNFENSLAAFVEEGGKLLAVILFICIFKPKYIFGGLLIGASVGMGFEVMENIGYSIVEGSYTLMNIRGLQSLGGHIMWAALEGGGLCAAKGLGKLEVKHLLDLKFLPFLAVSVALHYIWDAKFSIAYIPLLIDVKYLLLILGAIFAVYILIKQALNQVMQVVDGAASEQSAVPVRSLAVLAGPLKGSQFPLSQSLTIGRDRSSCNVVLPAGTAGVSRRHCSVELRPDGVYVMDLASSGGTFLQNGYRLPPMQWVKVNEPFCLGSRSIVMHVQ